MKLWAGTVETYCQTAMPKLGAIHRTQAVAREISRSAN